MRFIGLFIFYVIFTNYQNSYGQTFNFKRKWVDSVYNSLTEAERIGQLFMVAAYSSGENANQYQIEKLIKSNQIGGVIFMQGNPEAQARLTNKYQKMAKVPLLIGMDAEWGLGMRLNGVKDYPRQMMLGATRDSSLVYEMGGAIARQCKRLGVHINFAPTIDINNNPKNPVINFRSFGENKELVARLGIAYMKGMQDRGIIACAKHFPGHGDVSVDSHKDLPIIKKDKAQLKEMELYPFTELIKEGVKSVMIAHLNVPSLDPAPNMPTTLSYNTVTKLLKDELGFDGLIFTDALNMKGVTKFFPDGETDLKAFLAGNDVLLFSQNVSLAISKIQWALKMGEVAYDDFENRVKKILRAKYDAGLWKIEDIEITNIASDLNKEVENIKEKAAKSALTLVKDRNNIIGKLSSKPLKIVYINVNGSESQSVEKKLKNAYSNIKLDKLPKKAAVSEVNSLGARYSDYDAVIVGIHALSWYPGQGDRYGLDTNQINFLKNIVKKNNVIVVVFGNAYILKYLCGSNTGAIVAYEDNIYTQNMAFEILTGSSKAKGTLPVTTCN